MQTLTIVGNVNDEAMQACEALTRIMAERNALMLDVVAVLKEFTFRADLDLEDVWVEQKALALIKKVESEGE